MLYLYIASILFFFFFFFFNDTATTEIYTLSLHDALPICSGRYRGGRSGAAHLHQWHDRPAQGSAYAAAGPPRKPPGLRAFARSVSAGGRPVLVAGRLGVDRRPDGRAAAVAVPRHAAARLPRSLRSRKIVLADAKVRRAQQLPFSDCAQDDDEGGAAAEETL